MDSLNVYFEGKEQVELRREEVRAPPPEHVLIRTTRSLISTGTELICYERKFAPGTHWDRWVTYPFSPGYSCMGEVVEVGDGVTGIAVGDRVVTQSPHRQYATALASSVVHVPASVEDEEAAWFAVASVVQNGVRRAEHQLGENVVIIGAGILGQLAAQYVRVGGAAEIIVVDLSKPRLQAALDHGATATLAIPVQEARTAVLDLTGGRGADTVYDVTGFASVFPHALALARTLGTVVLLGDSGNPEEQRLAPDLITRGLRVVGAHGVNAPRAATDHAWWTHANMQQLFFRYLQRGQMRVRDMVTARHSPLQAKQAYADLLRDRSSALGVVFDWSTLG